MKTTAEMRKAWALSHGVFDADEVRDLIEDLEETLAARDEWIRLQQDAAAERFLTEKAWQADLDRAIAAESSRDAAREALSRLLMDVETVPLNGKVTRGSIEAARAVLAEGGGG